MGTSKRNSLFDSKGRFHWTMNGVGLEFNHLFGFGVLDAGAMVALARQWKSVPARYHCEAGSDKTVRAIPQDKSLFLTLETNGCAGTETEVNYLEHVQILITVNSTRRGDLELFTRSPMGTRSMILSTRPNDGFLKEWTLLLHGSRDAPYSDLPVTDPHSKLAIVKKAHEDKKKM